jgi:hypothetical protein
MNEALARDYCEILYNRDLLVDGSTFSCMTIEELLDADVLPAHAVADLRERYIPC